MSVELCLEALSSLSGCCVQRTGAPSQLGPQDLVNLVSLRQFYKQQGLKQLDYPGLGSLSLREEDDPEADLYGSPPALEAPKPGSSGAAVRVNPDDFFDRKYDYDFTKTKDGERQFFRGGERYVRPCGWRRVALSVTRKYDEGNDLWLGTGSTSWPVAYQGLHMDGSLGVIITRKENQEDGFQEDGFLEEAAQALVDPPTVGRGIYSTPDVALAEKFCKTFYSQSEGRIYKVLLQTRINPQHRRDCQRDRVWVVPVPQDHNELQTRVLVQESVRPYGLLLKLA